jgi:hypothetical protein
VPATCDEVYSTADVFFLMTECVGQIAAAPCPKANRLGFCNAPIGHGQDGLETWYLYAPGDASDAKMTCVSSSGKWCTP